jgi:hypothetical protein
MIDDRTARGQTVGPVARIDLEPGWRNAFPAAPRAPGSRRPPRTIDDRRRPTRTDETDDDRRGLASP